MFIEVFKYLPVATVLGERVLVIHGGLFHRDAVALAQLVGLRCTDTVAKLSPFTHETRRLSWDCGDGVEAVRHRDDAVDAT